MTKLVIFTVFIVSSVVAIEISSKIDFDNEDASYGLDSSSGKANTVVIVIENLNTDTRRASRGFKSSSASRPRAGDNVNFRGPIKPTRSYDNNPPPTRPMVVKNICIHMNGQALTKPDNFECREGVCETTLFTDADEMGNAIDSVRLKIFTKAEEPKQVPNIPVVDGVGGTQYDNRNPTATTLPFNSGQEFPHPPFLDNNIPQASVHRPNQVPQRYPTWPQSGSFYPRNYGPHKTSRGWNPWVATTGSIDDKIEPPLSQTIIGDK